MILTVNYDKATGGISVSSDVSLISVEVNDNTTDDNSSFVSFEVAIDTSSYEQINELPSE